MKKHTRPRPGAATARSKTRRGGEGVRRSSRHRTAALPAALAALAFTLAACATNPSAHQTEIQSAAVASVLNSLHDAASKADEARYFALFAPDAIFYGTDDAERWTVDQFRAYAHPYFAKGQGWTYTVADRAVFFSPDGRTAWFDERLDNAKWGRCRGSGVLALHAGEWRIEQYNLTVPIPNDLLPEVAQRIREFESTRAKE